MQPPNELYGVNQWDAIHLANAQVGVANLVLPPLNPDLVERDFVAHTNEEIWARIITPPGSVIPPSSLWANMTVTLKSFFLFEWFPLTPGLYHTYEGRQSRETADQHKRTGHVLRNSSTHHLYKDTADRQFLNIYDPDGKMAMLKGGVGCIHLQPKMLKNGESCFLSASSTGIAHEGFPVVLKTDQFLRVRADIERRGAIRCSLKGKLKFMPEPVAVLYNEYRGVRQLYLEVEELIPDPNQEHDSELLVSVGISFKSSYEGPLKLYASFATFRAGDPGAVADTANWLDEIYVRGYYNGKVVTDFDEETRRFPDATFALTHVMNNQLSRQRVSDFMELIGLTGFDVTTFMAQMTMVQQIHTSNYFAHVENMTQNTTNIGSGSTIQGNVGNVGNSRIENSFNTMAQPLASGDLQSLLNELVKAVNEAAQAANSPQASNAQRDARNLLEEATSEMPRPDEGTRLGERIASWARTIGETGAPIVKLIGAILPLVGHGTH